MNNTSHDLCVIIVSWNVRRLLDECLYSVEIALEGINAEIVVIDNASQDGSPQMVAQKYPGVHLIANPDNRGFGRANNQALQVCRGKYILLLNPDTFVPRAKASRKCWLLWKITRAPGWPVPNSAMEPVRSTPITWCIGHLEK